MGRLLKLLRRSSGGGAAFSPADVPDLVEWLKADAGLYTTAAGSTPAASNGDPVGRWEDQSAGLNHLTQATGAARPTLVTAAVNSRPCVRYDGVDDFLASAMFTRSQPHFLLLVAKLRTWTANTYWLDAGNVDRAVLYSGGTNGVGTYAGSDGPAINNVSGSWVILGTAFAGASSSITLNAGTPVTGNAGTSGADGLTLGSRAGGSSFTEIDVAEVIAYTRVPTAQERSDLLAYLNARYAIY